MNQLALPARGMARSTAERFEIWLRENARVYDLFVKLAREALSSGSRKIGARLIGERMRWEYRVVARLGDEEPALNDHWWPFLARKAMSEHADLAGLFETRSRG